MVDVTEGNVLLFLKTGKAEPSFPYSFYYWLETNSKEFPPQLFKGVRGQNRAAEGSLPPPPLWRQTAQALWIH